MPLGSCYTIDPPTNPLPPDQVDLLICDTPTSMTTRTGGGYGGKDDDDVPAEVEGKTSPPTSPSSKEADANDSVVAKSGGGKSNDDGEGKTSMESSTGVTEEQAPIIIEAGGRRGGPNLVQRFVDYVFRVIHTEMDDFFTRNATLFDQDWDDFNQAGETLEQYNVFKRYEELLDVHLTRFAENEKFDDAADCFVELQRLVTEDAEEHKKRMEEMQEQLKKAQEKATNASGGGGKNGEEEAKPQPLMIFFQPISLEQLMQMVLNMAEYPTFSFMMRMKVQQVKLMKAIREQMAAHTNSARSSNNADASRMEVQDIELINDEDFDTTTDRMNELDAASDAGGKSSPEAGSNRK